MLDAQVGSAPKHMKDLQVSMQEKQNKCILDFVFTTLLRRGSYVLWQDYAKHTLISLCGFSSGMYITCSV